ncbi:hypothetical protein ABNR98_004434 [Salmonella enterica]
MNFNIQWHELRSGLRLKNLKRNLHPILSILITYPLFAIFFGWFFSGIMIITWICILIVKLPSHLNELTSRMITESDRTWDIEINRVKVGTIKDSHYATIRLNAFANKKCYYAQAINIYSVIFNIFIYCCKIIPLIIFWIGVIYAMLSPNSLDTITAISHMTPNEVKQVSGIIWDYCSLIMLMIIAFHYFRSLKLQFGFRNCFSEEIVLKLRKYCQTATVGEIILSCHMSDEVFKKTEIIIP